MNRRHLGIGILVVWVGALGWLAAREIARRGRTVFSGQQAVSPGAAYYRVALKGAQVGYALLQVDTLPPTDTSPALVQLQSRLLVTAGDAPAIDRYEIFSTAWLTTDLRLWRSETLRGDPDGVVEWRLTVKGDTLFTLFVDHDSRWTSVTILDTLPVPTEAVPLWIATYGRPRPGQSHALSTIDLATLTRRRETWIATAESTFTVPDSVERIGPDSFRIASLDTVRAWRLGGTDRSVQVHSWIDENGFPIRWGTGGGWTVERDAFELALTGFREISDSLTGRSTLRSPTRSDETALRGSGRSDWTILLPGAEYPPLDGAGPMQRIAGDTLETFGATSWRSQQAFRPLEPLPMANPRFTMELVPEPRLSPEDTVLTARAVALIGDTKNAREAAMTLTSWVANNITTRFGGPSIRPAGAVLAERSGDPEEKAVLLVAMARRVGLPARLAGGVVHTPRGIRTHTWAELFIGDWVPMDPSQTSSVASSTHLRLVSGSTGRWTELFPLAGGLVATGRDPVELP